MSNDLKPCPFCGAEAVRLYFDDERICCGQMHCAGRSVVANTEAWNERPEKATEQPGTCTTGSVDYKIEPVEMQQPVECSPLPREECERIRKLDIRKNADGTYSYSSSGLLTNEDVWKAITGQEPRSHECNEAFEQWAYYRPSLTSHASWSEAKFVWQEAWNAAVSSTKRESSWQPKTEPPTEEGLYLVFMPGRTLDDYSCQWWSNTMKSFSSDCGITHWMPIPEKPRRGPDDV
jgi:hypothetical protein